MAQNICKFCYMKFRLIILERNCGERLRADDCFVIKFSMTRKSRVTGVNATQQSVEDEVKTGIFGKSCSATKNLHMFGVIYPKT